MSKVKSVLAAALTLAVVGTAANAAPFITTVGDVKLTITNLGAPPANSFGETASGYTAFDVAITTTDGSVFTSAATTFSGTFLQESDYVTKTTRGVTSTTYTPTPDKSPAAGAGSNGGAAGQDYGLDSHFLYDITTPNTAANELFIVQPTEDNPALSATPATYAPGSPGDDGADVYGLGTTLAINIGWKSAIASSTEDVAYLVVPNSAIGTDAFSFNVTTGTNVSGSVITGVGLTSAAPEPASLGLLGMGAVALLARRKARGN